MAANKIKFGKKITDGPGNDISYPILRDGIEVGVIDGSYEDIGTMNTVYRLYQYEVRFWVKGEEKTFDFDATAGVARANLSKAKAYAREVLT